MATETQAKTFDLASKKAPKTAFQFDVGGLQFADPVTAAEGVTKTPISIMGRSAQPINHWYWGKIVHDMAGFSSDHPQVPIDYRHDDEEELGYLDSFRADNTGLHVSGQLVSFAADDRVAKLVKKREAGIPYQASIFFRADRLEYVPEGFSTDVNGYTLSGPAIIVREWGLRGMAVCLYGADHKTVSQFTDGDMVPVEIFSAEQSMTKSTQTAGSQNASETSPEAPNKLSEGTTPTTPATAPAVDPRAELKKFVDRFGADNGSKWWGEGMSFSDAMEKHIDSLNEKLKAQNDEVTKLSQRLASIDRGGETPLKLSEGEGRSTDSAPPEKFAHLGDLGKFAASIKLPGSKK